MIAEENERPEAVSMICCIVHMSCLVLVLLLTVTRTPHSDCAVDRTAHDALPIVCEGNLIHARCMSFHLSYAHTFFEIPEFYQPVSSSSRDVHVA